MNGKTGRVLNGQVTGQGPCSTQWAECGLGAGWFKAVPALQLSEPGYGYHEELGWVCLWTICSVLFFWPRKPLTLGHRIKQQQQKTKQNKKKLPSGTWLALESLKCAQIQSDVLREPCLSPAVSGSTGGAGLCVAQGLSLACSLWCPNGSPANLEH